MTSIQLSADTATLLPASATPALDETPVIYVCPNCGASHSGPFGLVIKALVTAEKRSYTDKSVVAEWVGCDLCQDTIEATLGAPAADTWITVYTLTVGDSQRFDAAIKLLRLGLSDREQTYLALLQRVIDPLGWEETEHLLKDIEEILKQVGRV